MYLCQVINVSFLRHIYVIFSIRKRLANICLQVWGINYVRIHFFDQK